MTRCRSGNHIQNHRRIHRGLLAGLQFGKALDIGIKALANFFNRGFLMQLAWHILSSCSLAWTNNEAISDSYASRAESARMASHFGSIHTSPDVTLPVIPLRYPSHKKLNLKINSLARIHAESCQGASFFTPNLKSKFKIQKS